MTSKCLMPWRSGTLISSCGLRRVCLLIAYPTRARPLLLIMSAFDCSSVKGFIIHLPGDLLIGVIIQKNTCGNVVLRLISEAWSYGFRFLIMSRLKNSLKLIWVRVRRNLVSAKILAFKYKLKVLNITIE
jgi:hypothetical protein